MVFIKVLKLLVFTCVAIVGSVVAADAQEATTRSVAGRAADLSISTEGETYAIGTDGRVWHWRFDVGRWGPMSGRFKRISAAEGNRPWVVDADNKVYRYNGLWWEVKGEDVVDVGGDASGTVYVARTDGTVAQYNPLRNDWNTIPEPPTPVRRLAVGGGAVWALGANNSIVRLLDGTWTALPGVARDIAVGGTGEVFIAAADGSVRQWDETGRKWTVRAIKGVDKPVATVAVAPDSAPWIVRQDGSIVATGTLGLPPEDKTKEDKATTPKATVPKVEDATPKVQQASVPVAEVPIPPATTPPVEVAPQSPSTGGTTTVGLARAPIDPISVTHKGKLVFTDTLATASSVEIGRNGHVFVLDGGRVKRWSSSRKALLDFPGQLARLAVDGDGNPWGINALGRIFRYDGKVWRQVSGTASDIAVGPDGAVMTVDSNGYVHRYNTDKKIFVQEAGLTGLTVLAIGPDGRLWAIGDDGYVRDCAQTPCRHKGQLGSDLAVGPDGSVFIIDDTQTLRQWNVKTDRFDRVIVPGYTPQSVAVGPNGYPWVVATDGTLLSTHEFNADEPGTIYVAGSGSGSETTGKGDTAPVVSSSAVSGFAFTKNMTFETYSPSSIMASISVGVDDTVVIRSTVTDPQQPSIYTNYVYTYNTSKNAFESYTYTSTFPAAISDIDVDSEGNYWAVDAESSNSVHRITSTGSLRSYSVGSYGSGGANSASIAIAPDDTVWVTNQSQVLYYKDPTSNSFRRFSHTDTVLGFAIASADSLWILDANYVVKQWTGSKFENRPYGQTITANSIGAGADGTIYITKSSDNYIYYWNATNNSFDKVTKTAQAIDVTSDGRPWALNTSTGDVYRAKD